MLSFRFDSDAEDFFKNWGDNFKFTKEDLKLEVHWQNLEDARTKLLHPYQYGVTRYICDSLSAFLSTDIDILKYLIIKETSCFLIKNNLYYSGKKQKSAENGDC